MQPWATPDNLLLTCEAVDVLVNNINIFSVSPVMLSIFEVSRQDVLKRLVDFALMPVPVRGSINPDPLCISNHLAEFKRYANRGVYRKLERFVEAHKHQIYARKNLFRWGKLANKSWRKREAKHIVDRSERFHSESFLMSSIEHILRMYAGHVAALFETPRNIEYVLRMLENKGVIAGGRVAVERIPAVNNDKLLISNTTTPVKMDEGFVNEMFSEPNNIEMILRILEANDVIVDGHVNIARVNLGGETLKRPLNGNTVAVGAGGDTNIVGAAGSPEESKEGPKKRLQRDLYESEGGRRRRRRHTRRNRRRNVRHSRRRR